MDTYWIKTMKNNGIQLMFYLRVILMNTLGVLVNNPVKKKIMEKEKKAINVLTIFFIFHKSDIKIFLK